MAPRVHECPYFISGAHCCVSGKSRHFPSPYESNSRAGAAKSDKLDDPGAKRFLEAARKAGAEETEKGADRDFRKAVKPRIAEMKAPLNP